MADVNANIGVHIDTSDALAQLKNLQRQLSQFHTSVAKSSSVAAAAQKSLQKNLINSINSIGGFTAELRTVKTTTESFTNSLEKNKFSMREYFRYAGASTKTFGRLFTSELDTISKVAEDRVKKLQTQYIKLGRDSQGAMKAIAVMPNQLDFSKTSTQLQLAAQKQAIFNQLLKQGSTNLLNFGKNTQWAGRQLMVGFTIPLGILGMKASQTFMEMEQAALKFKKVYGDLLTSPEETKAALDGITELGKQYTKYGVAVADTVALSAEAAAAGFQGLDLQRQTAQATRLSVLGQIESQQALETTIALQNAFKMSSEDLAGSIDFLNAVENQTVTSLDDITTAIPKVAPVIQQLGGDVKDLAFFITAMKEGGINASEGANALKSGLAALINPTSKATSMLADMGININNIVESNKGDLKATVIGFAKALDTLDPLARARAIEQMFGKFQFARLSTLFQNVTKDGTQAGRVLKLAGTSISDLAALSEKELGMTAASPMNKFKKAVEDLKLALVPVGETFLKSVTPIVDFFGNILEKFSGLSDNTKKIITIITIAIAGVGPVLLMTFGLLANGIANIIKLFATLRNGYLKLTGQSTVLGEQTQYMTDEQLDAAAAAHSLNQSHATLKQTFDVEKESLDKLIASYQSGAKAARAFAASNPGAMLPVPSGKRPKKFAVGKPYVVGGSGNRDSEPAMLAPGETVIPAKMSKKYGKLINGMIAGNIPGYETGKSIGKKVILPGGMDVSHFGAKKQMSGKNLIQLFDDADPAIKAKVKDLVNKFKDGSTKMFTVFDNQVVALFADVNRDLDKKGKVSKARLKENLLGEKFAPVRDIELQRQFENAGKSPEEFAKANKQLTEAIQKGFNRLGDVVDVTEQQVNDLIETAYKEVAATNKDVAEAHKKMKQVSTVTEPDVGGVRGKRVALSKESYVTNKKGKKSYKNRMTALVGAENIPYNFNSEFNISNEMLKRLGMTGDQAAAAFKKMSAQAQLGLAQLKGNTDAFVKQFEIEAKKIGVAYSTAVKQSGVKDIYVESRDRKSPHRLAPKDGKDDAIAYDNARDTQLDKNSRTPTRKALIKERASRGVSRISGLMSGGSGLGISSGLMMGAQFMPGKAGQIAGQASSAAFVVQSLMMLPGPLKLVAGGLVGVVGATKLINIVMEKQRLKVEGLGDAALLTKDKLKTLGDFFGVTLASLPYERNKKSGGTKLPIGVQQRSAVDQLRENEAFQKDFAKDIASLKNATVADAKIVLSSLAIQLKGRGLASEQIKTIIQALQEEAGKTNLNLNFKNIGIATESALKQQVGVIAKKLQVGLKDALTRNKLDTPYLALLKLKGSEKQALDMSAKSLFGIIQGLVGQFEQGTLSAADLNAQFGILSKEISQLPKATQLALMTKMFVELGPNAQMAAKNIDDVNDKMKVLLALSSGIINVTDNKDMLDSLSGKNGVFSMYQARRNLNAEMEKFYKAFEVNTTNTIDETANAIETANQDLADKFNLAEYIKGSFDIARNQVVAYRKLRDAGIDAAMAMDLVSNADLAAAVIKEGLTEKMKQQIYWTNERIKQLEKEQKAIEDAKKTEGDRTREALEIEKARFDLQEEIAKGAFVENIYETNEALRNSQYELELVNRKLKDQQKAMQDLIDPKQTRINDISYQLEGISFQEDEINDKYDRQSKLLSTITKMNQDLFSIQKKRASLADALSSGDISAAASIIMEMRAEEASIQATSQQDVLDAAREQELKALGRVALEKESKKLQYEILTIQRNQSKELQDQADAIQNTIDNLTNNLADYEQQSANAVYAVNNKISAAFGLTKTQIESALSMLDLAKIAGFNMNNKTVITNILDAAIGKANELKKILGELPNVTVPPTTTPPTANLPDTKYNDGTYPGYSSVVTPPGPTGAPTNPKAGDSAYIGSELMTWDGSKWVYPKDYNPPYVEKPVPRGAAPVDDSPAVVFPKEPATTLPTGPGPDPNASQTEIDRERGRYQGYSIGGLVPKYFARGGFSRGTDTVPAMLTPGEFVVNRRATAGFGIDNLSKINNGEISAGSVYNYKVDVTLNGSDMNPNDVANAVLTKIKQLESRNIRRQGI